MSRLASARHTWAFVCASFAIATFAGAVGCASFRPMVASSDDLADYRAFRVAAAEGTRLARAKHYLERHPKGAFAVEVQAVFDEEEPPFFERSQRSREAARRYLADLPDGPHATAAIALLTALEATDQDIELRDVARRARSDDARLEVAAVGRREVGEAILGAVGALLDDHVYGASFDDASPLLRKTLQGPRVQTWGPVPAERADDYYFLLPTRPERESRVLTLSVSALERDGVIVEGRIEGVDMFVLWTEADQIVSLDRASAQDRARAQSHVMERLTGALERRFPSASPETVDVREGHELYHRRNRGWEAVVLAGARPGDVDSVVIRGPRPTKGQTTPSPQPR